MGGHVLTLASPLEVDGVWAARRGLPTASGTAASGVWLYRMLPSKSLARPLRPGDGPVTGRGRGGGGEDGQDAPPTAPPPCSLIPRSPHFPKSIPSCALPKAAEDGGGRAPGTPLHPPPLPERSGSAPPPPTRIRGPGRQGGAHPPPPSHAR
ncbi:hypothetical protein I4F81_001322 [Pyropia yezoensis]|uniref:Uncharacterized protein n=1 Tax=Pyropia yezoensis TaxID=2788 RepID=A0ACC3BL58_PYRYE|nr:hypothetical protein I4F81_001322 [Neopyropia yezoensis]